MAQTFDTEIGKIYCAYNDKEDKFDKIRIINLNNDGTATIAHLDEVNHISTQNTITMDELNDIRKNTVLLKSDGIASITNVVSITRGTQEIKDVIVIYFPDNKMTKSPEPWQPYIVARQSINNIFAAMANEDTVGMAVSIDTLPNGYALSDFMVSEKVLSSRLIQVYKTDTATELSILMDNEESNEIMRSMYEHAINFRKNTSEFYSHEEVEDDCVGGYCNSIKRFLVESDFMGELYNKIGIVKVDFELETNKPIDNDDKLFISTLCGGIRINKAVPMLFDYDINIDAIKMRYLLVSDVNDILWIVPYTVSDNEIDADAVYKITEEATNRLQERLKRVIKAYDKTNNT